MCRVTGVPERAEKRSHKKPKCRSPTERKALPYLAWRGSLEVVVSSYYFSSFEEWKKNLPQVNILSFELAAETRPPALTSKRVWKIENTPRY